MGIHVYTCDECGRKITLTKRSKIEDYPYFVSSEKVICMKCRLQTSRTT